MFRNIFSQIENINILPIVGMFIFIVLFIAVVLYVIKLDKGTEKKWAEMPFNENNDSEIKF